MVDAYRLRSPLAHLALDSRAETDAALSGTGVVMSEVPHMGLINIRGDANDPAFAAAVEKALKLPLPISANTVAGKTATRMAWLGPDEWLVITKSDAQDRTLKALTKSLKVDGLHSAVTNNSDSRTCIRISGPSARDVLRKGCSIDLHPDRFSTGQCAQTVVSKVGVLLVQTADSQKSGPAYELYVLRSFASYGWAWIVAGSHGYGLKRD